MSSICINDDFLIFSLRYRRETTIYPNISNPWIKKKRFLSATTNAVGSRWSAFLILFPVFPAEICSLSPDSHLGISGPLDCQEIEADIFVPLNFEIRMAAAVAAAACSRRIIKTYNFTLHCIFSLVDSKPQHVYAHKKANPCLCLSASIQPLLQKEMSGWGGGGQTSTIKAGEFNSPRNWPHEGKEMSIKMSFFSRLPTRLLLWS